MQIMEFLTLQAGIAGISQVAHLANSVSKWGPERAPLSPTWDVYMSSKLSGMWLSSDIQIINIYIK